MCKISMDIMTCSRMDIMDIMDWILADAMHPLVVVIMVVMGIIDMEMGNGMGWIRNMEMDIMDIIITGIIIISHREDNFLGITLGITRIIMEIMEITMGTTMETTGIIIIIPITRIITETTAIIMEMAIIITATATAIIIIIITIAIWISIRI